MERPINIFSTAANYAYKKNKRVLLEENLHTAFFAYILNCDTKLLKYLLEKLLENKSNLICNIAEDNFDYIVTQASETFDGENVYPDMKIRTVDDSLTVYIENKIESVEGRYSDGEEERSQLNNYLKLAKRSSSQETENFLIYLTKYEESISQETEEHQNFVGSFRWSKISEIIDEYIQKQSKSDSEKSDLVVQFKDYMEEFGLGSIKGKEFQKEYGQILKEFYEFFEIENFYWDEVEKYFKNKGYIIPKQRQKSSSRNIRIYKSNWNSEDIAGFWFNIFFDVDSDLELEETEGGTPSVVMSVRFCCSKKLFDNIKSKYKNEVSKQIKKLEERGFYDLNEKDPVIFEGWTPLKQITKNYTLDKDKQIEALIASIEDVLNIIESSGFIKLLEENYPILESKQL